MNENHHLYMLSVQFAHNTLSDNMELMTLINTEPSTSISKTQADFIHNVDDKLFSLVSKINILEAIKPLNFTEQRKSFLDSSYSIDPTFTYQKDTIDSFKLKRELFNLPVDDIDEEDLRNIYLNVVDSFVDKIDQFKSIGSNDFIYDSLRYYGEPSTKDIRNSNFILHLPDVSEPNDCEIMDATYIESTLKAFADKENYQYELVLDNTMIANALASGHKVKINNAAKVSKIEANALANHELGVHLVTTLNARKQPFKILSLGCPSNTTTQEGMAILSEYLSGCLTLKRLKILALRVLAVESMIKEKRFRNTFLLLKEQYQVEDDLAFTITARVYRGGGFTKDYLYLQGFHQVLNAYEELPDFQNLLAGKTSLEFLPSITRLIKKGVFIPPVYITPAFMHPTHNDDISRFITHAIK